MRETEQDLTGLQSLLDGSYAVAGDHLNSIHTDKVRLAASELVSRVAGMKVMVVATVTSGGRPVTGPVDAFLYRGQICFGTAPTAMRARHLRRRPDLSVSYVDGETLTMTVHGRAVAMDLDGVDAGFGDVCREQYGPEWDTWDEEAVYFKVTAQRMFAADMSRHLPPGD